MRNFQLIGAGVDTMPLLHNLFGREDLWNTHRFRTTFEGTPHVDVEDILLRFSPPITDQREDVYNDTAPVWYPANVAALPAAKPLVLSLMARVEAYELGRVIVTRIRPGGRILPHTDNEGDYVNQTNIMRYHIVLQGRPGSLFQCGEEVVCMKAGEVWTFNAHVEHSVLNNSDDDRIHLIADMTLWPR